MPRESASARLVVLASGSGSNLQAILDACAAGDLPAQVTAVISDRKAAYALERARMHAVPAVYHPFKPYADSGKSRADYDLDLAALVRAYQPDWVVLAGWMRLLTMPFLSQFSQRVVNLHPALPGTFPGTHAIQRAYAAYQRGEIAHTGIMVHLVSDEGIDDGPVLAQKIVPILPEDSLETLETRIHATEHALLVATLRNLIEH
ncbi:MAG: phosphoribosylglycinamide formyltransferase [Anaerolineales bacterium]